MDAKTREAVISAYPLSRARGKKKLGEALGITQVAALKLLHAYREELDHAECDAIRAALAKIPCGATLLIDRRQGRGKVRALDSGEEIAQALFSGR